MGAPDELLSCMERGDVAGCIAIWQRVAPHLPVPESDAQAQFVFHRARTETQKLAFRHRAYSHSWLVERGLPSGLPDHLKPKAARMYPRVVEGVGVSVKARNPEFRQLARDCQKAMTNVVEEMYADGATDPDLIKTRMHEARKITIRRALGKGGLM
jgi:hypothetical protein